MSSPFITWQTSEGRTERNCMVGASQESPRLRQWPRQRRELGQHLEMNWAPPNFPTLNNGGEGPPRDNGLFATSVYRIFPCVQASSVPAVATQW